METQPPHPGAITAAHVEGMILKLAQRYHHAGRAQEHDASGIRIGHFTSLAPKLAPAVARDLRVGAYRFGTWVERPVRIGNKDRKLYRGPFVDMVVCSLIAEAIRPAIERHLPLQVHSYRRGYSQFTAIDAFRRYLARYRRHVTARRERALFVRQRDIRKYGESISVAHGSPLWEVLREVMSFGGEAWLPLIEAAITPAVRTRDGRDTRLDTVPTGSPLQPLMCNLLMLPLDRQLAASPSAFYARFGDDFLMVTPNVTESEELALHWHRYIAACGLTANPSSARDLYFTGPGRPAPGAGWQGARDITYLGFRIDFFGHTSLKRHHLRVLLRGVRGRLWRTNALLGDAPDEVRARALCSVASRCLDPSDPLALPGAQSLHRHVNDRGHLKQLDHWLALTIAELLAKRPGPRAFRRWPRRQLRAAGLVSLTQARRRASSG